MKSTQFIEPVSAREWDCIHSKMLPKPKNALLWVGEKKNWESIWEWAWDFGSGVRRIIWYGYLWRGMSQFIAFPNIVSKIEMALWLVLCCCGFLVIWHKKNIYPFGSNQIKCMGWQREIVWKGRASMQVGGAILSVCDVSFCFGFVQCIWPRAITLPHAPNF